MDEAKPDHKKAARAAREAQKKAEERRAAEELLNRRARQLESAQQAVKRLQENLSSLKETTVSHRELSSHLDGFYEEIDKLTKGKAMIEVTPLMLEQVNDVIRDSKTMIKGDTYLDRIKEFVPAGNNPLYPDVLVTLRTVQQGLERFEEDLDDREGRLKKALTTARTIAAALEFYLEVNQAPSKDQVRVLVDGSAIDESWFHGYLESGHFDFSLLDRRNLDEYLAGTDGRGQEEEEERE